MVVVIVMVVTMVIFVMMMFDGADNGGVGTFSGRVCRNFAAPDFAFFWGRI